jgi:hypothetical protein
MTITSRNTIQAILVMAFSTIFIVGQDRPDSPQVRDCGGIGGVIREQVVSFPQRGGGATLTGKIYAPDLSRQTSPCPIIALLPGGGGSPISTVEWAAQRLAASGYVVISAKPELPNSVISYDNAARSGLDFAVSPSNPFINSSDVNVIGVAGWSLGAFALSITQEQDTRVNAYIGWDNMVMSETGDAGTANCIGAPTIVRTPRVPAMGQASETCVDGRSADAKKTAFNHWKAANQPAMQLVFRNMGHTAWSSFENNPSAYDLFHYFSRNWFDRWLKQDLTATSRLFSRTVNSVPVNTLLSANFRSAAFLDEFDCGDIVTSCSRPYASINGRVLTPGGNGLRNASVSLIDDLGERRIATTSSFGLFSFANIHTGRSYTIAVNSKRYRFASQVLQIDDNVNLSDLVGLE